MPDFTGSVQIPVGLAGPLRINGLYARGNYALPLATTDSGLIAACAAGFAVIADAGGCNAMVLDEGVGRGLAFGFRTLQQAGLFAHWVTAHIDTLRRVAATPPAEATLTDLRVTVESNHVDVYCEFAPGDAFDGESMGAQAVQTYIRQHSPVRPLGEVIRASPTSGPGGLLPTPTVQGRRVSAEVILPGTLAAAWLGSVPEQIEAASRRQSIRTVEGPGYAPGLPLRALTALFAACGQDMAAAAISAAGSYRVEVSAPGELYAGVTLPHVTVGTVGGGTALPAQRAGLELLGLAGPGRAPALAEVCAGLCLAAHLAAIAPVPPDTRPALPLSDSREV